MLLYDVTSDRSFLSVRQWVEAVDVRNKDNLYCAVEKTMIVHDTTVASQQCFASHLFSSMEMTTPYCRPCLVEEMQGRASVAPRTKAKVPPTFIPCMTFNLTLSTL